MAREEKVTEVIWSRIDATGRRAQPFLDYGQIVEAAVEIADADGIDALSMRKVATRLGTGTMTLYRYVSTKDELIDLMTDSVLGEVNPPAEPTSDWRGELADYARRTRRMAFRHPWAIWCLGRANLGPNLCQQIEHMMTCLDGLEIDIDEMLDMSFTVNAFTIGFVQIELSEQEARRRTGLSEQEWRERMAPYITGLLSTGKYPWLERIVHDAEDFPDPDETFERRLAHVLDGLTSGLPT
ncbi:hypothetical protein BLA60_27640 [Actinophytocola xinjiangensis]|uniref:HTH tetR-type domain-containing protein n=1 Tax=Actinophytocola xinjiangensis TaxID=485602 RepID=A0A7Z0WI82_9PSEU|nr:hypothetical protein BLA60_27640 [Actinophytocola xinjiangensis]